MSEEKKKGSDPIEYCKDCGRSIGIGCACGMSFSEKIRGQKLHTASWSETKGK